MLQSALRHSDTELTPTETKLIRLVKLMEPLGEDKICELLFFHSLTFLFFF